MSNGNIIKITSLENPYIKHLVRLRENRAYREECGSALLAGELIMREVATKVSFKSLITTDGALLERFDAPTSYLVTPHILQKISAMPTPPALFAEALIARGTDLSQKKRLIACERISDPGNLGTLVRTAVALGWEGIILLEHSTDLFHDKAIRASRGSSLFFPYSSCSMAEFATWSRQEGFICYLADLTGQNILHLRSSLELAQKRILILGSEAQGLSKEARMLGHAIRIPTSDAMSSLNVAIAGAILMYELSLLPGDAC